MKTLQLSLQLRFPIDARSPGFGRVFWDTVSRIYSELMPGKYGNTEPLTEEYDGYDTAQLFGPTWQNTYSFIWKSRRVRSEGIWSMTSGNNHSSLFIYGRPTIFRMDKLSALLEELASNHPVDIGFLHILGQPEFQANRNAYKQQIAPFNAGCNPKELEQFLPNLAWGTYFGEPYVDLIGRDILLDAPAAQVKSFGNGIFLKVSEHIEDTYCDYEKFEQLRDRIKQKLGQRYFFDLSRPPWEYDAPKFKLPRN